MNINKIGYAGVHVDVLTRQPGKMLSVKQLCLLLGVCFFPCVVADNGDDFSNNLFTDLAPCVLLSFHVMSAH